MQSNLSVARLLNVIVTLFIEKAYHDYKIYM